MTSELRTAGSSGDGSWGLRLGLRLLAHGSFELISVHFLAVRLRFRRFFLGFSPVFVGFPRFFRFS